MKSSPKIGQFFRVDSIAHQKLLYILKEREMRYGIRAKILIYAIIIWVLIFGIYSAITYKQRIEQVRRSASPPPRSFQRKS